MSTEPFSPPVAKIFHQQRINNLRLIPPVVKIDAAFYFPLAPEVFQMNRSAIFPLILSTCILAFSTNAQTLKFRDVPGRSGVESAYDKFNDRTILSTKRDLVTAIFGKSSVLNPGANERKVEVVAGFVHNGQKLDKAPGTIFLVVNPNLTTGLGQFVADMDRQAGMRPLYFPPDAELIAIVDGERLALGKVEKSGQLTILGRYDGAAYIEIPLASFRRVATAKKIELALGGVELAIYPKHLKRWAALIAEIDARAEN